jgi:hypothetical protein
LSRLPASLRSSIASAGVSARRPVGLGQVQVDGCVSGLFRSGAVELVQPLSCCARARPGLPSSFLFRVDFFLCVHKNIEWIKWYSLMGVRKSPQKAGNVAKIVRPALDPEHKLGPLNKPRIYFLCGPDLNRIGVEQMSSHAWPSTSHRVRFVSPRDLLLDHRSDATSNKIAWSQHVSIPIVHVPLLPAAPRLDMALPAFTRATNATWMENHSLIYD